jgi:diadenosine tetraphosphate (Ap4A) HIT family hydrolase
MPLMTKMAILRELRPYSWRAAAVLDNAEDNDLLIELVGIIKQVAVQVVKEHGACRVITNLGEYQDSKHLHWHVVCGRLLQ